MSEGKQINLFCDTFLLLIIVCYYGTTIKKLYLEKNINININTKNGIEFYLTLHFKCL